MLTPFDRRPRAPAARLDRRRRALKRSVNAPQQRLASWECSRAATDARERPLRSEPGSPSLAPDRSRSASGAPRATEHGDDPWCAPAILTLARVVSRSPTETPASSPRAPAARLDRRRRALRRSVNASQQRLASWECSRAATDARERPLRSEPGSPSARPQAKRECIAAAFGRLGCSRAATNARERPRRGDACEHPRQGGRGLRRRATHDSSEREDHRCAPRIITMLSRSWRTGSRTRAVGSERRRPRLRAKRAHAGAAGAEQPGASAVSGRA